MAESRAAAKENHNLLIPSIVPINFPKVFRQDYNGEPLEKEQPIVLSYNEPSSKTQVLVVVSRAPQTLTGVQPTSKVFNHLNNEDIKESNQRVLGLAIFSTICCCVVFSIFGIYYALRGKSEWEAGHELMARQLHHQSRSCSIAAILTGFFLIFIILILYILSCFLINSNNNTS